MPVYKLQLAKHISEPAVVLCRSSRSTTVYEQNGQGQSCRKMWIEVVARHGGPSVNLATRSDAAVKGSRNGWTRRLLFFCRRCRTGWSLRHGSGRKDQENPAEK